MKTVLTCSRSFINFTEDKQTSFLCACATISTNHHLSHSLMEHIVIVQDIYMHYCLRWCHKSATVHVIYCIQQTHLLVSIIFFILIFDFFIVILLLIIVVTSLSFINLSFAAFLDDPVFTVNFQTFHYSLSCQYFIHLSINTFTLL